MLVPRDDLGVMQKAQPDYSAADLAAITVPVWAVLGEGDEFIRREHMQYISETIPGARFASLPGQSHDAAAELVAPVLIDFFTAADAGRIAA